MRRSLAKEFTQKGLIKINGFTAKASHNVKIDDEIEIRKYDQITTVRVLNVPQKKQVSKRDAKNLYEIISEETVEDALLSDK